MASARPVIAGRVGGVPEIVVDGVTGLLVDPEDPRAIAAALRRLLGDPDLRRAMGAAGRERVERELTHARAAREIYAVLTAASRSPLPPWRDRRLLVATRRVATAARERCRLRPPSATFRRPVTPWGGLSPALRENPTSSPRGRNRRALCDLLARFPSGSVEVLTVQARPHDGPRPPAPTGATPESQADAGRFPFPVMRLPWGFREASRAGKVLRCALKARRLARERGYGALQIGTLRPAGPVGAWLQRTEGVPYVIYVHGKDVLKERHKVARSVCTGRRPGRLTASRCGDREQPATRRTSLRTSAATLGAGDRGRVRVVHPGPIRAVSTARDLSANDITHHAPSRCAAACPVERTRGADVSRLEPRRAWTKPRGLLRARCRVFPTSCTSRGRGSSEGGSSARPPLRTSKGACALGEYRTKTPRALCAGGRLPPSRASGEATRSRVFGIVSARRRGGVPAPGVRGVPEAVRDGETGLLVDPDDPRDIAAALRRLLADRDLAAVLGRGGRRAVETYLNWDRAASEAWQVVRGVARREPAR